MTDYPPPIYAIDLFCGAGGLSYGLKQAGIKVIAGFDLDPACKHPYEENVGAEFHLRNIEGVMGQELEALWPSKQIRLLAGCAPCQPFSSHRRGKDTSSEKNWSLLAHFARLVEETHPELVTMENVVRLHRTQVFSDFIKKLNNLGYSVSHGSLYGPQFGLPQARRRLVVLASRLGSITLPTGWLKEDEYITVRQTIGELKQISSGDCDRDDSLHIARKLTPINLARIRASKPGGSWEDWPEDLRTPCQRRKSGSTFGAFYGRMQWDYPAPTITTQSYNLGAGRFGHPEQDRTITLREAAMLQGFPREYSFVPVGQSPSMLSVGRLIGNAVPPPLGRAVGLKFIRCLTERTTENQKVGDCAQADFKDDN